MQRSASALSTPIHRESHGGTRCGAAAHDGEFYKQKPIVVPLPEDCHVTLLARLEFSSWTDTKQRKEVKVIVPNNKNLFGPLSSILHFPTSNDAASECLSLEMIQLVCLVFQDLGASDGESDFFRMTDFGEKWNALKEQNPAFVLEEKSAESELMTAQDGHSRGEKPGNTKKHTAVHGFFWRAQRALLNLTVLRPHSQKRAPLLRLSERKIGMRIQRLPASVNTHSLRRPPLTCPWTCMPY